MASEAHLNELNDKHRKLDQMIAREEQRPSADVTLIKTLKRKKLLLKDRIESESAALVN